MPYERIMQGLEGNRMKVSSIDLKLLKQLKIKSKSGSIRDSWDYYKLCREITQANMVRLYRAINNFNRIEQEAKEPKKSIGFHKRIFVTALVKFAKTISMLHLNLDDKKCTMFRDDMNEIGTILQRDLEYDLEREFNVVVDDIFAHSPYIQNKFVSDELGAIKLEILTKIPIKMDSIDLQKKLGFDGAAGYMEADLREKLNELWVSDSYINNLIKKYHSGDEYDIMRLREIAYQVNLKAFGKEDPAEKLEREVAKALFGVYLSSENN